MIDLPRRTSWFRIAGLAVLVGGLAGCLADKADEGEPPQIILQPFDTTVAAGGTATFTVTATGTAPLSYQWTRDGEDPLAEDTMATLVLTNVALSADGTVYRCLVRNRAGTALSEAAELEVLAPVPVISVDPSDQVVNAGQLATFTVAASGTGFLAYQWMRNGQDIAGATSSTYVFTAANGDDGAEFKCRISDEVAGVTSAGAFLRIRAVAKGITLGAQGSTAPSSLDIDEWISYYHGQAPTFSEELDLVFAFSSASDSSALYSPIVAKNGTGGSAGFDFMQTCPTANNTDMRRVQVADWNNVVTAADIRALYDAGTTPNPAGRIFLRVGTTVVARSNRGLYVALRVAEMSPAASATGAVRFDAKARW
jgi:hypothetical protein